MDRDLSASNLATAQAKVVEHGFAGFISDRPEDVAYLFPVRAFVYRVMAESRGYEVVLLPASGQPQLLTADGYVDFYRSCSVDAAPTAALDQIVPAFATGASGRLAVSPDTSARLIARLKELLPEHLQLADPVLEARQVKSFLEVEAMRRAVAAAVAGMTAGLDASVTGARECDAAGQAELAMRRSGADAFCFSTIVSSGPDLGYMREVTGERQIDIGDWVMLDLGCSVNGYNAEFARTLIAGEPTPEFLEAHGVVAAAQRAAIDRVRPGGSVAEADRAARAVIARSRFRDAAYRHITGHGIGTAVWEPPFVSGDSDAIFEPGMVVCIEPGVFIPGVGGVRVEDVVLVNEHGHEVLTKTPHFDARRSH